MDDTCSYDMDSHRLIHESNVASNRVAGTVSVDDAGAALIEVAATDAEASDTARVALTVLSGNSAPLLGAMSDL